jgi:hypothetical protein
MIAGQIRNERQMREEGFWKRVNIIKACHDDAIDFVDTADALIKNGLSGKFHEWMKQQNVGYSCNYKRLSVGCLRDSKQEAHVYYVPKENAVCFGWNGWGMCEFYSTNEDMNHFIHNYLKGKGYDKGLTIMATRLQPFLKAFFEWVETI